MIFGFDCMPFIFKKLEIPDVALIESESFSDERGRFLETYKSSDFQAFGINSGFVQDSCSYSKKGVLRGMHYQKPPFAQAKLIKAVKGRILDVAVDIRSASASFGQWVAQELSEDNNLMLYIPEGFAHGFLALTDEVVIVYKMSKEYAPESDSGIIWNDPKLNIKWPIINPIISKKDSQLPLFQDAFLF